MVSATFRCLRSGHTVTFTQQVDIDSMEYHPDYEYVEEHEVHVEVEAPKKKVGRPAKKDD